MHPVAGVDTLEFVELHWAGNASKRHRPNRLHSNEPLHQSQRVACQQDRTRRRKLLYSVRDMVWDTVKTKGDEIFPLVLDGNNDRTGNDPDPDFKKHSELTPNFGGPDERCLLHLECGVAGSDRVIFKSNGCPEAGHDSVALFSANPAIVVNDVVHGIDGRFQDPASVLRIAVIDQRGRASDVGEENGYDL